MDPLVAKGLFHDGAIILMMNVPPNFEVGIDGVNWKVGPLFKGIKMIPAGFHFISYQLSNSNGDTSMVTGSFHFFKKNEILSFNWDKSTEQLVFDEDEEQLERYRVSLQELDKYLGPFPYDRRAEIGGFLRLTRHITPDILAMIIPSNEWFWINANTSSYHQKDANTTTEYRAINFTEFPTDIKSRRSMLGTESKDHLDQTSLLNQIIRVNYKNDSLKILGEFELAFILLVFANNFDGFEQWQSIMSILCQCPAMVKEHPVLFIEFLNVMIDQLSGDQLTEIFDGLGFDNKFFKLIKNLFDFIEDDDVAESLKARASKFSNFMKEKFEWDLNVYNGDDNPTIVEQS